MKTKRFTSLSRLTAALALGVAMAIFGTTGIASAQIHQATLSGGPICTTVLCMSANGTTGDKVYGKLIDDGREEDTRVVDDPVCSGSVVTTSPACPFINGSGLNAEFKGKHIVVLDNENVGQYYVGRNSSSDVVQGVGETGQEWIAVPDGTYNGFQQYEYVNVNASDSNGAATYVCTDGTDNPLDLQTFTDYTCVFIPSAN